MTAAALHIAAKDVRQLRVWLGAFFAVVVLRAALVSSGFAVHTAAVGRTSAFDWTDATLGVLHLGLLVTIAVQLVHVDRLVSTTAFWLTRPLSRRSLLAAKLLTVSVCLVVVPFLLDAVVLAAHRGSALDVLGAIAEDTFVRLAIVLPMMALAAVTSNLTVFVLSGYAAILGTLALEVALVSWKLLPLRSAEVADSSLVVGAGLGGLVSLVALAYQVFTRRTSRTVQLGIVASLLVLLVAHRWDTVLLQSPAGLERGWFDPSRVALTMSQLPPEQTPLPVHGGSWLVRATSTLAGAPADVVLVPVGVESATTFRDGTISRFQATDRPSVPSFMRFLPRVLGLPQFEAALYGSQLVDTTSAPAPVLPIASLTRPDFEKFARGGARFDTTVTVGALHYAVSATLPLQSRQAMNVGSRRVAVRRAVCETGRCSVELVEEMPAFTLDLRRPSSVIYVLVNRSQHRAVLLPQRGNFGFFSVFGRLMFPLLAQHVSVITNTYSSSVPGDTPALLDEAWLREAAVVAIEARDLGSFTVRAKIAE